MVIMFSSESILFFIYQRMSKKDNHNKQTPKYLKKIREEWEKEKLESEIWKYKHTKHSYRVEIIQMRFQCIVRIIYKMIWVLSSGVLILFVSHDSFCMKIIEIFTNMIR